ncbi:hypothetical protein Tco_0291717 [Tanacetum coccineum]
MLEKSMYDSWASRIRLFIKGNKNGRMMLDSIDEAQQLQDDCDVQATNIILHGLPPDVYALVNHQEEAKDIWDRVKLLMKDTELSYQERECRLYNLFDKFTSIQGETLQPFKMEESQFNKFKEDKLRVLLAIETEELLQPQGETMQLVKQSRPQNSAFHTKDLDAYDLNYDVISSAKVVMMANLLSCDSDVLFEESLDTGIQDTNSSTPNDLLVLSLVKQMTDHVANLDMEN